MFTQKGIKGIPGLLSEDTFFGFFKEEGKAKLVSGGRYRPFTPIMFALEYQFFGKNPFIGHLINALLYGLLGFFIFQLLSMIFKIRTDYAKDFSWIIFAASLLFIAHPIHTEAVANIKGRDEIMALLGSIIATIYTLKYIDSNSTKHSVIAFLGFFIGIMSKENAITFLAIIPAIAVFFYNKSWAFSIQKLWPVITAAVLFLIIRTSVLGFDFGGTSLELMNNPFLKLKGNEYVPFSSSEKLGTIFYTLWKYLSLLFFPHPLTHDYYPRHIDITSLSNIMSIIGMVIHLGMIAGIFYYYKRDRVISFCLLYYLVTLSIVSNIVFPIGTNMSERFVFMPSLAFCILVPHIIYKLSKNGLVSFAICGVLAVLLSIKTINRNQVWVNDFTLFTTDVKTSKNSAKVLNAAGGALSTEAAKEKDPKKKEEMLKQAVEYLDEAIKIHPTYKNAYLLKGNSLFFLNDLNGATSSYEAALKIDPNWGEARNNLAVAYRDAGKFAGEKQNDIAKAESLLLKSFQVNPNDTETLRLLGVTYGISGRHQQALEYFLKMTQLDPKNADAFANVSSAYNYLGDKINAEKYRQISLQLKGNAK
jgi:Tfp pilus assembly protein PilF